MTDTQHFRKEVTDNGLRVLTEFIPGVESASVGVWICSGSAHESPESRGLSHFLEHMVFKGTERRSTLALAQLMDSIGGHVNAFTDREYACFHAKVLADNVPKALDLLCDMVANPALTPQDVEIERGVVLEELRNCADDPEDYVLDLFTEKLWEGSSLGHPLLGTEEMVASFTSQSCRQFMAEHYVANNMVVVAAGKVRHEDIVGLSNQYLSELPPGDNNQGTPPAPRVRARTTFCPRETEQVYLCVGTRGYPQTSPERFCSFLLDTILAGGCSSRLFQEVRDKRGLVYNIQSCSASYRPAGYLAVTCGSSVDNAPKVADLIGRELRKVRNRGVTKTEFHRAKVQLKTSLLLALENTGTRMSRMALCELYHGRFVPTREVVAQVDRVACQDVHRVACAAFEDRWINVAAVGPPELERVDWKVSVE